MAYKAPVIKSKVYSAPKVLSTTDRENLQKNASDVIKFGLSDGSSIVVRPSGTEPKLKLYISR